jgi:hypothetical protein
MTDSPRTFSIGTCSATITPAFNAFTTDYSQARKEAKALAAGNGCNYYIYVTEDVPWGGGCEHNFCSVVYPSDESFRSNHPRATSAELANRQSSLLVHAHSKVNGKNVAYHIETHDVPFDNGYGGKSTHSGGYVVEGDASGCCSGSLEEVQSFLSRPVFGGC